MTLWNTRNFGLALHWIPRQQFWVTIRTHPLGVLPTGVYSRTVWRFGVTVVVWRRV